MGGAPWFSEWFNTEYYHLLYSHRSDSEASMFIDTLCNFLKIKKGTKVADIACGKGRHTAEMARLELQAIGFDLSEHSIACATETYKDLNAQFFVHDMRSPLPFQDFGAAFNLFTSFGYFDNLDEDNRVIDNIFNSLNSGGYFIQDYICAETYLPNFPSKHTIEKNDIVFLIDKYVNNGFIIKNITVIDKEKKLEFQEKIRIYTADELSQLHRKSGFTILHQFGDYNLNLPNNASPRIILISQKN